MSLESQFSIFAVLFGVLSIALSVAMYKKMRAQRGLLEFVGKQVDDLEEILAKNRSTLETNAQRVDEQARRIAWLETRVRQSKPVNDEVIDDTPAPEPSKLNITERRHRVITLASRGQNAETIAATLGMLPGEVELIINLSQTALDRK
jgi:hypothetical protein